MEMRDLLKRLDRLCRQSTRCELEDGALIVMYFDSREELRTTVQDSGLIYQERGSQGITIDPASYPGLFFDREHFKREAVSDRQLLEQSPDIGILRYTPDSFLSYDCQTDSAQIGSEAPGDLFIQNMRWYYRFFDYILQQTEIVSYHNEAARELVLMDREKGKFLLGYPALAEDFDQGFSVEEQYKLLVKMPTAKDFQLQLEMQIVDVLEKYDHDQCFPELIKNFQTIKSRAENSYKLFLSNFDFEKFHQGFQQKRDAYFKSIRDVIDGLLSKVVAIPVSISAAALAIYNVREEPLYSTVVMVAFLVYSLFTSYLMRLSHGSIFDIETALEEDIVAIREKTKIPREEFHGEEGKLKKKIARLRFSVAVIQLLLSALSLAVVFIYTQQLPLNLPSTALLTVAILVLQLSIAFVGVRPKNASGQSEGAKKVA